MNVAALTAVLGAARRRRNDEAKRHQRDGAESRWVKPEIKSTDYAIKRREDPDLDAALDALERMVRQYMPFRGGEYDHMAMSAGESAAEVLSLHRPEHWEDTGTGLRPIDTTP